MKVVLVILVLIAGFVGYGASTKDSYENIVANELSAAIDCSMNGKELDSFWVETTLVLGHELWSDHYYNCREPSNKIWQWSKK